jgi:hypothetical protein
LEATMLLCDFAEEVGGKLYIMGGGWSRILKSGLPTPMSLAVKLSIPWDQAETLHKVTIRLVTVDGELVAKEGQPVRVMGEIGAGKPPGLRPGTPLDLPFAVRFEGISLDPGEYRWELEVDDEQIAAASFEVMAG